jgi:hypothetical protein
MLPEFDFRNGVNLDFGWTIENIGERLRIPIVVIGLRVQLQGVLTLPFLKEQKS